MNKKLKIRIVKSIVFFATYFIASFGIGQIWEAFSPDTFEILAITIGYTIFWFLADFIKNKIDGFLKPTSVPSEYGAKGTVKELYEYLESRALTLENVRECNSTQMFPLWVNIDDVYHLLEMYQEGCLKEFLDKQDASGYWSFGYDACDFKMREFPDPKPEFPPNRK